jgi:hypothetical protein
MFWCSRSLYRDIYITENDSFMHFKCKLLNLLHYNKSIPSSKKGEILMFHPFHRPRRSLGVARYSATLFLDLGTRRGRGVSVTPRPLSTPGKDPEPIVQEAGWALESV